MKFFRRSEGHDFVVSIATKAMNRMPSPNNLHIGLLETDHQVQKGRSRNNSRFGTQTGPFQNQRAGMRPTGNFGPFTKHRSPRGLVGQFRSVRVGVPVEAVHTVGIRYIRDRNGDGGEDTSVNSVLKQGTKVHVLYLFRLGVVPVYTGRGLDASLECSGIFYALSYTRGGYVGYVLNAP